MYAGSQILHTVFLMMKNVQRHHVCESPWRRLRLWLLQTNMSDCANSVNTGKWK